MDGGEVRVSDFVAGLHRPTDVEVGADGELFIVDWGTFVSETDPPLGTIYRVTYEAPTAVFEDKSATPVAFSLDPPAPNPFNPETVLRFGLPRTTRAALVIYDVLGQPVQTLADERLGPGSYAVTWNGRDQVGRPAARLFRAAQGRPERPSPADGAGAVGTTTRRRFFVDTPLVTYTVDAVKLPNAVALSGPGGEPVPVQTVRHAP